MPGPEVIDDEPCEFCGRTRLDGPCAACAEDDPNGLEEDDDGSDRGD